MTVSNIIIHDWFAHGLRGPWWKKIICCVQRRSQKLRKGESRSLPEHTFDVINFPPFIGTTRVGSLQAEGS